MTLVQHDHTDHTRRTRRSRVVASPIGELLLVAEGDHLCELRLPHSFEQPGSDAAGRDGVLDEAEDQLDGYFSGARTRFDLPLEPGGTVFQRSVWFALAEIPFAATESYGSVAARVGNPRAGRAVGMANNRNPLAIILPCHRVIGSSGRLVGYGGGLEMKQWLLDHEQAVAAGRPGP